MLRDDFPKERGREGEKERDLPVIVSLENCHNGQIGPGEGQEPGSPSWSSTWVAGAQAHGHPPLPSQAPVPKHRF